MAALVVLLCAIAVQASAQRYKSEAFSVTPPTGWTTKTQGVEKGKAVFLGPREGNFAVNINILSESAPHYTLSQYVDANHRQMAAHPESGIKMLKDDKTVMAGAPAHTLLSELRSPDHPEIPTLRTYQVYAMHKERGYVITLTYPKSLSDASVKKYRAAFDKFITTFKWE